MRTLEDVDPNMGFGVDANGMSLGGKPELAVLVARVIAAWATVESYVSLCSNALLAGQSNVAAAVYAVLSENALQYAALYAAADAALSPADAKLFRSALKKVRALGQGRHRLAHGVFAHSEALPGDLIIFEQRDFAELTNIFFTPENPGETRQDQVRRLTASVAKRAVLIGKDDLEQILKEIDLASDIASDVAVLAAPVHPDKVGARTRLLHNLG